MLRSNKEKLFRHGTNVEIIGMGLPVSIVLPGKAFWLKNKAFKSSASILNFDPVTTNKSGYTIYLDTKMLDPTGGRELRFTREQLICRQQKTPLL